MTTPGPITEKTPVRFHDPLPEAVDVVIIGGGVVGIFSALYLNRAGKRVLVCDKGRVAGEQSSRNWGWIRQQRRDRAELPIMMEATRLWEDVSNELGDTIGFKRCGITYLARSNDQLEKLACWLDIAREHQVRSHLLSTAELRDLFSSEGRGGSAAGATNGQAREEWVGGITTPSDARAEPWLAVPAVADLARSEGVLIRENCAVRSLESSAGQLRGVHTEDGYVACEQAVLAAGAWSSLFARNHDTKLPQLTVRATVMRTQKLPEIIRTSASDGKLAIRRRADGGYTLAVSDRLDHYVGPDSFRNLRHFLPMVKEYHSTILLRPADSRDAPNAWTTRRKWAPDEITPFERQRVLSPKPNVKSLGIMQERFASRFPGIGKPQIKTAWAGMIDTTPDIVPVIDRHPNTNGLIIATGMSGHGFGIGPGVAMLVKNLACGTAIGHDLSRFRLSRFSDGSKLEMGPSL